MSESASQPSENRRIVRIPTLEQQGQEHDWAGTTIGQRWAAMWPLALEAWAAKGERVDERLRRDIVQIRYRDETAS